MEGQQVPTRLANLRIRLPLQITGVDRRYLQPLPSATATPTTAARYPGMSLAFRLPFAAIAAEQQHGETEDEYDDLETAVT